MTGPHDRIPNNKPLARTPRAVTAALPSLCRFSTLMEEVPTVGAPIRHDVRGPR